MSEITNASLTTDIVLFAESGGLRHVLLIRRGWAPYAGHWALPGGYVDNGERFITAARRELTEETGLTTGRLDMVGVYDEPDRDPRGRVISVAFTALLPTMPRATAGDDARDARWIPVDVALSRRLAFDHDLIVRDALNLHSR
ncbi:NUDIX hydrolase [Saccharopolyspora gregorii]|uniref:Nudix hydrolase domain-containing protein n=1 Tax=Saccharopolyspora gregorii TaxID=33914 RepID=A0ABP6RZI5_9PSEU